MILMDSCYSFRRDDGILVVLSNSVLLEIQTKIFTNEIFLEFASK